MPSNQLWTFVLVSCLIICAVSSTFGMDERIDCGRRKLKTVFLIRNGTDAIAGHWPWHVTIFHLKGNNLEYACGGSILDRDTILTAAHCVTRISGVIHRRHISVQLGRTDLKEEQDYIQSHNVQEIIVHPQFSGNSVAHDIALVKLATNITMSKYVQPVCLWNLNDQENPIIGKNGTIVGFGLTENDTISDHLKKAVVSVIDPMQCIESDRDAFGHLLTSEMICGKGQNGVSACNGDSGGGMFFEVSGKWFVRGLVSFTPGRENNSLLCDGIRNTVFKMSSIQLWKVVLVSCLITGAVRSTLGTDDRIECGRRKLKTVFLIRNGTDAIAGHWPWHVTIFHLKGNNLEYACGGSILDRNTILTAAHCVTRVNGVIHRRHISVQLGRTKLKDEQDYIQSHDVQEIIVHPLFSQNSVAHDIALVKLAANITMSKYVQPVCIWNLNDQENPIIGKNGTIVGFGLTVNDTVSDHLKNALVSVVEPLKCIENDRDAFGHLLTSEMICANGQNGVSACNGDSGGGMFFEINGKWFVRGLVSFTPGRENNSLLCDGIRNTVFSDVAKYGEWITKYIDPRVLHDESDVIVDYDEKLKLFNFDTHKPAFFWVEKQIQRVIIHPKFDNATYANDIALIELYHPANMTSPQSRPICLPVTPAMRKSSFDNLYSPLYTPIILTAHMNNTECMAKHTFARSILQVSQFCVGFENSDKTEHLWVRGTPVLQKRTRGNKEQFFLQGFQTQRYVSNFSNVHVFTDTNKYIDWILYNMKFNNGTENGTKLQKSQLKSDEWPSLFSETDCGKDKRGVVNSFRYPTIPWMGWLHSNRNISIADLNDDAIATLIHKRRFATFGSLGSYYSCRTDECEDFIQELDVREITIHPNYTKYPRRNDIALIELWPEIDENHEYIRPICLPWIENVPKSEPLRLTVPEIIYFSFIRKELKLENSTTCLQRFLANGYQFQPKDVSICTMYSAGEKPFPIASGAPLQMELVFNGDQRFFVRGLFYNLFYNRKTGERKINSLYMSQLFTDINPFLDWIAEEVGSVYAERSRMTSNAASKEEHLKSNQVHLLPMQNTITRRQINFVDDSSSEVFLDVDRTDWFGLIHRINDVGRLHKCGVTVFSEWYGISTASCAVNYTGDVLFVTYESQHRFPVQKVIVHPEYRSGNLNNNIALIQFTKSALILNPIDLPIINEIRTLGYKRSDLKTFSSFRQIKLEFLTDFYLQSVGDRYVDWDICQTYWNESKPKYERHQSPLQLNSTICINYNKYGRGAESEIEASPMCSIQELNDDSTLYLRGISLKSGTMARYASMYYLEIDGFLDWILENMNNTLRESDLPSFDLRKTLLFN
uniref:Peptidase S1 domain-containing protein n=1 Tax=Anopheles dirus TaxID=7168 RepID=A0A182MY39_9DIPT